MQTNTGTGSIPTLSSNGSFAPPRASFSSSSRASPVGHSKTGREDPWPDNQWRNIFDAALVKAQQAVQLDELQETALAANLYAQAANDLGRVIPMCTSEKKKQSMLAIQAIYLDRVSQLREAVVKKDAAKQEALNAQIMDADSSNNGYSFSVPNVSMNYVQGGATYQSQQFQSPQLQPQQSFLQIQSQSPMYNQATPQQLQQLQQQQLQYQQQIQQLQLQQQQLQLQQQQLQYQSVSPSLPPQQQQQQQQPSHKATSDKGGFRLFGKKRSKTQPSSSQPPVFLQSQGQLYDNTTSAGGFVHYSENSNDYVGSPYMGHQKLATASPSTPVVSPIYMSTPPSQASIQAAVQPLNDMLDALDGPVRPAPEPAPTTTAKSSKWKSFGKKKSKSVSVNMETNLSSGNLLIANDMSANKSHTNSASLHTSAHPQGASQNIMTASQQHPQQLPPQEIPSYPVSETDVYPQQQGQVDWYVANKDSSDEFDNLDKYLDDEDEDVDPYYIADTKGRARAFEGQDSGLKGKEQPKEAKTVKEEVKTLSRKTKTGAPSSYSEDKAFSPRFSQAVAKYNPSVALYGQEDLYEERIKSFEEDEPYMQHYDATEGEEQQHRLQYGQIESNQYQKHDDTEQNQQQYLSGQDYQAEEASPVAEAYDHQVPVDESQANETSADAESNSGAHHTAAHVIEEVSPPALEVEEIETEEAMAMLEKTKSKRTWYGKKKKDKEKSKEDKEEKEKEKKKELARLIDEALFGEPVKTADKSTSKQQRQQDQQEFSANTQSNGAMAKDDDLCPSVEEVQAVNSLADNPHAESNISSTYPHDTESLHESGIQDVESASASQIILAANTDQIKDESESVHTVEVEVNVTTAPKRSKSRHFSVFRSKKKSTERLTNQQQPLDGGELTPTITNEDDKSVHSHHTRKSSVHGSEKRAAAEMAAALAVRPKDVTPSKKRHSDEYVPYEYQEEVEGPLMERVPVPENREVIGFVLPVEEIIDYHAEGNEEAALDNWDSWVNQLESFEKVLSDKGLKKEKIKKAKKEKETKDESSSPMGSVKNNRSSIFGLGRADTVKSRDSSTLDLNSHLNESRPLSMSTTLLDEASIAPRQSFQSSRSGGSEAPSQMMLQPQIKKRWWKRKDSTSMYRVSNAYSTADLEQDRHLTSLLQAQSQVKSADDLTLETTIMSVPTVLDQVVVKEAPANEAAPAENPTVEPTAVVTPVETQKEPQSESEEEVIAPPPKLKAKKSVKPKLLPISTPLPQLLRIDNPEELWQYVQQAKTYATSRMNKGDKRSAAIALKRAQALEARWQEILLEMASSDEDTDEILEEEEDDEESEESEETSEEEVVVVKKTKSKDDVKKSNRVSLEIETVPAASPAATLVDETKVVTPTTPTRSVNLPTPPPSTPIKIIQFEDDDDDERENYAASRRRSISRSNSTPDKYSKYKIAKSVTATLHNTSKSLEENEEEDLTGTTTGETQLKSGTTIAIDDGRLGPDATLEQMLESTNVDHVRFYIQRMKTDTVAKARNGSKFAALEGMKNVKVLQQHLEDLQTPPKAPPVVPVLSTVSETIVEEDEGDEEVEGKVEEGTSRVIQV
ncbi:hypothetical protein BG004_006455 [Podila humilis]|nr:hypothetical protein BG004_006455 [Podila humilis]